MSMPPLNVMKAISGSIIQNSARWRVALLLSCCFRRGASVQPCEHQRARKHKFRWCAVGSRPPTRPHSNTGRISTVEAAAEPTGRGLDQESILSNCQLAKASREYLRIIIAGANCELRARDKSSFHNNTCPIDTDPTKQERCPAPLKCSNCRPYLQFYGSVNGYETSFF
jgi:hypothetical protein